MNTEQHTVIRREHEHRATTVVDEVDVVLSFNPESKGWEVWCLGLCETFTARVAAVCHIEAIGIVLGLAPGWLPADY